MAYRRFNQTFHHGLNAVLLLALLMPKLGLADTLIGEVVAVTDGDSITVVTEGVQYKIRLTGIDAPERHQAYGLQSKQSLFDLVSQQTVKITYQKYDKYNRILGKVYLDGLDINLAQIKSGSAWHYRYYQKEQNVEDRALYAQAAALAKKHQLGLWKDANPIAPWDFRKTWH
ncbi:MAG: thermonuclease family protein [Methylophilaceae bacterium]|nr:thermonuclease family protein [Methylophilaceae bacterium]